MVPTNPEASTSVLVPFIPRRTEQLLPFAALTQWSGAARLWQGQSMVVDTFQGFAAAAGAGFRIPTGIGVSLMPLKHPLDLANQAASLASATGHPVTLGIGPGDTRFQAAMLGEAYQSQIAAVREYATIVRGLLSHDEVAVRGEYFSCTGSLAAPASQLVTVGLGVLRARMARLAGEVADTAITWLTPARYIADHLAPEIAAGEKLAGADAAPTRIVAMVPVAVDRPGREAVPIALSSNRMHMAAPHYQQMLARAGIAVTQDASDSAAHLVEGRAFLYGDTSEIADMIREFHDAGVAEVVLNTTGVRAVHGVEAAISDLRDIIAAVR